MKKIVILYHGDCRDGFSGAWAAWKKFGKKADYFGLQYGADNKVDLPKGLKNKIIYLVDFGLKGGNQMKQLIKGNKKVVVLDHHLDAEKFAKMANSYVLDNNRSGATIAWHYFHPKKPTPTFLKYVEDLDIWRHRLPYTFAVSAYIELFDFNFKIWDKLVKQLENSLTRKNIFEQGKLLLKYENNKIKELIEKNSELVKFAGYKVKAVNSSNWTSQIGNILCTKFPPLAIIWSKRGKQIVVSLRSDGSVDVSKIAKKFGGGGHKAAAGFSIKSLKDLPWKSLK